MILNDQQLKIHFEEEIRRWFSVRGDYTHRLDYPLSPDSVAIDLGGYQGWWTEQMYNKYGCSVHAFEPVAEFYNEMSKKFAGNPKIKCYQYGLGASDGDVEIVHSADGTSMHINKSSGRTEVIKIRRAASFIEDFDVVDVLKINIEGSEYELMEHLIDSGCVKKIKNIQIQFHTFMPNCQERRNKIRERLSHTHDITYNYDFVWENWLIK